MPDATRIPFPLAYACLALALVPGAARGGQRPTTMESCKLCHAPADAVVRGKLVSVVPELGTLSVSVGPLVWIVRYGGDVKVKQGAETSGPDALKGIPRDREIAVVFTGPETKPVAVQVAVKQPFRVAPEKLLTVERVQELVARAAADEKIFLFDARPAAMFAEGHIPGAASLPYAAFKDRAPAMLPADKSTPVAFYCAGET